MTTEHSDKRRTIERLVLHLQNGENGSNGKRTTSEIEAIQEGLEPSNEQAEEVYTKLLGLEEQKWGEGR